VAATTYPIPPKWVTKASASGWIEYGGSFIAPSTGDFDVIFYYEIEGVGSPITSPLFPEIFSKVDAHVNVTYGIGSARQTKVIYKADESTPWEPDDNMDFSTETQYNLKVHLEQGRKYDFSITTEASVKASKVGGALIHIQTIKVKRITIQGMQSVSGPHDTSPLPTTQRPSTNSGYDFDVRVSIDNINSYNGGCGGGGQGGVNVFDGTTAVALVALADIECARTAGSPISGKQLLIQMPGPVSNAAAFNFVVGREYIVHISIYGTELRASIPNGPTVIAPKPVYFQNSPPVLSPSFYHSSGNAALQEGAIIHNDSDNASPASGSGGSPLFWLILLILSILGLLGSLKH